MKRRISALALAGILAVTSLAAGCGKNEGGSGNKVDGEALSSELNNQVYKAETIDVNTENMDMVAISKGGVYVVSTEREYPVDEENGIMPRTLEEADGSETEKAESVDESDTLIDGDDEMSYVAPSVKTTIKVNGLGLDGTKKYEFEKEYGEIYTYFAKSEDDGTLYLLYSEYDADYSEHYYILSLDSNGKEKWSKELNSQVEGDDYYNPYNLFVNENGATVISSIGIETINSNGESINYKKMDAGGKDIGTYIPTRNGSAYCIVYGDELPEFYELDIQNAKLGAKVEIPFSAYMYSIEAGRNHDLILSDSEGLSYFDFGDKEVHKFMDYVASDVCISSLNEIVEVDETSFFGTYYNEFEDKYVVARFTKVDPSKVANRKTLSLGGMWIDNNVKKRVIDYNRSNSEYRIVIVDYTTKYPNDDWNELIKKINNDIITGKVPDIMMCNTYFDISAYASKGVFAEIDSYLNNDTDIKLEDYATNVIDAMKINGKSYYIVPSFSIRTALAKTSKVGNKTSWNMEEFRKVADNLPEGTSMFDLISKTDFVNSVFYYNSSDFIDKDTGKVSFDSPEFISILEYANTLPQEIDYEKLAEDYWVSYETLYRTDKAVLQMNGIYDIRDAYENAVRYFGEPVTYIGFPTSEGYGSSIAYDSCYAISAKSEYKDEAWEFVKGLLSDEYQESIGYSLPLKKSVLEKKAKEAMEPRSYENENGDLVYEDSTTMWVGDMEIEVKPPTQSDVDQIMNVIYSTNKISSYNTNITDIITEETQAYFNGQKSAEEVAKIIQSRVQVYENENR